MPNKAIRVSLCDSCNCYHFYDFDGDCRDDENRFASHEDAADRCGVDTVLEIYGDGTAYKVIGPNIYNPLDDETSNKTTNESVEQRIVTRILQDMNDRGLRETWDSIDTDCQDEIIYDWCDIVKEEINSVANKS